MLLLSKSLDAWVKSWFVDGFSVAPFLKTSDSDADCMRVGNVEWLKLLGTCLGTPTLPLYSSCNRDSCSYRNWSNVNTKLVRQIETYIINNQYYWIIIAKVPFDDFCSCCVADWSLWLLNCLKELPPGLEKTLSISLATDSESTEKINY
jgi:hypothetical protein